MEPNTEYIIKPIWINYIDLLKSSKGFSRFILYTQACLDNEIIDLDLLRKYYISNHEAAINLIDELSLRGFKFVSRKPSSILPEALPLLETEIVQSSCEGENYKSLNFEKLGLGDFNNRFEVRSDTFFNKISLNAFTYLNKAINLVLLKQEFINSCFKISSYREVDKGNKSDNPSEYDNFPANFENQLIADVFNEKKYAIFRSYCSERDFITMKDILALNFDSLINVQGIGKVKIELIKGKYYETIGKKSLIPINRILSSKTKEDIRTIHKDFNQITINYIFDEKIVNCLNAIHIFTIDNLSTIEYDNLSKIYAIGSIKAQQLIDEINLFSISIEEYMLVRFDNIKKHDGYEVYRERVLRKTTLEQIGTRMKKTKERVRQIQLKVEKSVLRLLLLFEEVLIRKGAFLDRKSLEFDELVSYLGSYENALIAKNCIKNNEFCHIQYFEELDRFFVGIDLSDTRSKLVQILDTLGEIFNFYNEMVAIEESLLENEIDFIDAFSFEDFIKARGYIKYNDYYSKKNISRELLCQIVLKDYFPVGMENTPEDIKKMHEIISSRYGIDSFDESNLRNTWVLLDRDGTPAILWGKSTRMHIDNVKINDGLIAITKDIIDGVLEKSDSVSADYIYSQMKPYLLEEGSNISNKDALYGIIQYYLGNNYSCKRLTIKKSGMQEQNTQTILENLLLENNGIMLVENVRQHLKWTEAMLSSGINFNKNILYWDNGRYLLHATKLQLTPNFKEEFLVKIKSSLIDGYINSYMILKKAAVLLLKNRINDPVSVFSLANYFFKDQFFFSRRPHILTQKVNSQFTSVQLILKMFLEKPIISYGELKHKMINEYAFTEIMAGNYLDKAQSKLFQLDMDLYCLPKDVAISQNDVDELLDYLNESFLNKKYVVITEFDESNLSLKKVNVVDRCMEWNRYIVKSIVESNWADDYRMIIRKFRDWRYDVTVIVPVSSEFETLADVIIHIVETEYKDKGNMMLNQIEEFLKNKRIIYSKLPEEFFNSNKITIDEFGRVSIAR